MKRRCLDCPKLIPVGSYKSRCPDCNRARERKRGSFRDRGYDAGFSRRRKQWADRINSGERVDCWRCGKPIAPGTSWHLGHADHDPDTIRGPEHAFCNLSAAGRSAHTPDPTDHASPPR